MRDIIFRGKRLDNGKWVYGYYFVTPITAEFDVKPENGAFFASGDEPIRHCVVEDMVAFEVDPSTVGQYTGLKDRAGEMIWEGDILSDGAFTYEVRYKGTGFVTILDGHVYTMDTRPTKIVIGNIHDNPDLLK